MDSDWLLTLIYAITLAIIIALVVVVLEWIAKKHDKS